MFQIKGLFVPNVAAFVFSSIFVTLGCQQPRTTPANSQQNSVSNAAASKPADSGAAVEKNLATFDTLDFDVFTNQKWDRLQESHAKDILVHWPDGHTTKKVSTNTSKT